MKHLPCIIIYIIAGAADTARRRAEITKKGDCMIIIFKRKYIKTFISALLALAVLASATFSYAADTDGTDAYAGYDFKRHWASEDIEYVLSNGYMTPQADYIFGPYEHMTRAVFIQSLAAVLDVKFASQDTTSEWGIQAEPQEFYHADLKALTESFSDIDADASYAEAVAWALENGIVNGRGDGTFGPDDVIDRQTMAVMIQRAADALDLRLQESWSVVLDYNDLDQVSDWAIEGIAYCSMTGLLQGDEEGNFSPRSTLSRAEGAVAVARLARLTHLLGQS